MLAVTDFFKSCFLKTFIFKIIYFLKTCPIFVCSLHNYIVKKWWFPLKAYKVSCPTCTKNLEWYILVLMHLNCYFVFQSFHWNSWLSDLEINFWPCRVAVIGTTSKNAALPSFKKNRVAAQETYLPKIYGVGPGHDDTKYVPTYFALWAKGGLI